MTSRRGKLGKGRWVSSVSDDGTETLLAEGFDDDDVCLRYATEVCDKLAEGYAMRARDERIDVRLAVNVYAYLTRYPYLRIMSPLGQAILASSPELQRLAGQAQGAPVHRFDTARGRQLRRSLEHRQRTRRAAKVVAASIIPPTRTRTLRT